MTCGITNQSLSNEEDKWLYKRNVIHKVVHPGFNDRFFNNIGLLFLEEDFDLRALSINVACLPTKKDFVDYDPSTCLASGWGKRFEHSEVADFQFGLVAHQLPIVGTTECENELSVHSGKKFKLHESQFCAGGMRMDTCDGDGGGPMVCNLNEDPTRFVQVGIVSARIDGSDCGQIPSIYGSVSNGICFIKKAIECKVSSKHIKIYCVKKLTKPKYYRQSQNTHLISKILKAVIDG